MAHLLYRLTHRLYRQRATLRSLHVLGTALELGCPLDQSLALTAELSETWGLRDTWAHIAGCLADGGSLSQAMSRLQPPFTPPMAALVELGEVHGNMSAALLAASGGERIDAFAPSLQRRARSLADSLGETCILGPVPRIGRIFMERAASRGCEGLGLFISLPNPMDGPRKWVEEAMPVFLDRTDTGAQSAVAVAPAAIHTASPLPLSGEIDQPVELLHDAPFDPALIAAGQSVIGFRKDGEWSQSTVLPNYLFSELMRHLLYRARIPYWTTESRQGWMRIEVADRWRRLSARFAPSARQLSLTLYFDPAVTAA